MTKTKNTNDNIIGDTTSDAFSIKFKKIWSLGEILLIVGLLSLASAVIFAGIMAYAEIDEKYQGVTSECDESIIIQNVTNGTITTSIAHCEWIVVEIHKDIIAVEQPDLTPEEQEVIDEAKECREDDFCDRPQLQCEPPMTLNILGDRCVTPPPKVECDAVCKEKKTTELLKKIYCEDTKILRASQQDLCNAINELSECSQGILKLETIQETRSFLITLFIPDEDKAYDFAHTNVYLGKLLKAQQECRATWVELYGNILSAEYAGKVPTSLDSTPYHADFSTATREYPAHKTPEGMMDVEAQRAQTDAICTLQQFGNIFKKQQGCDSSYLLDYPSYYAKSFVVNPSLGIPIEDKNGAYQEYLKYRADEQGYRVEGQRAFVIINEIHGDFAIRATPQR